MSTITRRSDGTITRNPVPIFGARTTRESIKLPPVSGVFVQTVECVVFAEDLQLGDVTCAGTVAAVVLGSNGSSTVDVRFVESDHDGPVTGRWDHFSRTDSVDVERTVTVTVHLGDHLEPRRCSNVPHDPALCHDGCDPF